jgi:predicted SAM-dependent methyltransferase
MGIGMRINVGCGKTPTEGWRNFDNSLSLRIAKVPFSAALLRSLRLIQKPQYDYIQYNRSHNIEFGNAIKRLPLPDNSVEVLYSSHMIEHLDRDEMDRFLREAMRVLQPGGILRLAFPDIRLYVRQYLEHQDADQFVADTLMAQQRPKSWAVKLTMLLVGSWHHLWMYDGNSLCRLLAAKGFVKVASLAAGETHIPNPGPLDLSERADASAYVEAEKPGTV